MFRRVVLAAALALMLISCADNVESPQPVEKTEEGTAITLHFNAVEGLNPGVSGHPAPVRVRVYELRTSAGFLRADYFTLVEHPRTALGPDLIEYDEVLISAGQKVRVDRELNPGTRKVGLVVGYREVDQALWRTVLTVTPRHVNEFAVGLDVRAVRSDGSVNPAGTVQ